MATSEPHTGNASGKKLIRRILVPVDYSECSGFACRYAIKLAHVIGAEIRLFHAYYTPAFDLVELAGTMQSQSQLREEVFTNLEENEQKTMEDYAASLREYMAENNLTGIPISHEIVAGVPEDEIIRHSREYEPDMVVMGTKGRGKGINAIMGSVTAGVIARIQYPLMAIPEKYTFIGEKNIKNIVYVTEFDESDFLSLKKLIELTDKLNLNIHCVHIGEDPKSWDKVKMEGLMEYFRKSYGKTQVEYSFISQKRLLHDIDALIREKNIHILSLTAHRQSIFEKLFKTSMTKTLFYHTSIPLLVFRG